MALRIDALLEVAPPTGKSKEMKFVEELIAVEAAIDKKYSDIKYFVPSAPVLGLNEGVSLLNQARAEMLGSTAGALSYAGHRDFSGSGGMDQQGDDSAFEEDDDDDMQHTEELFLEEDSDFSDHLGELDDSVGSATIERT